MTKKINKSIIYKAVAIAVMILLMLIPLFFVGNTIDERGEYRQEAVSKIIDSWGGNVIIAAPVLNIPYTYTEEVITKLNDKDVREIVTKTAFGKYAPDDVNADINVTSQIRYIGIFKVPVFTAEVTIKGSFGNLTNIESTSALEKAFITFEINSLKGINKGVLIWNESEKKLTPDIYKAAINLEDKSKGDYYYDRWVTLKALGSLIEFKEGKENTFELRFTLKGSENISFVPLGKNNKFHISSDWQNPNFSGAFLPDTKDVTTEGFDASWDINYLASGISPRFDKSDLSSALFTTSFIIPVDNYRSAQRAVKYGILFIVLTFAVCFAFEVAQKKPIHPIQYLLVGFAMVIFYTLLVSISEFLSFTLAYFIAAAATITLISVYAKVGIVKDMSKKQVAIVAASLVFLYGFLFILLRLQDMALLYGSLGLFIALGVIMYMTRNIGWYEEQ